MVVFLATSEIRWITFSIRTLTNLRDLRAQSMDGKGSLSFKPDRDHLAASGAGRRILTINAGSSSLKTALFEIGKTESMVLFFEADRIGIPGSRLRITDSAGSCLLDQRADLPDHESALRSVFEWLENDHIHANPHAVGHRIVYGGDRYREPCIITPGVVDALKEMAPIDPDHMPQAISAVEFTIRAYPDFPQVACFDTAFHRTIPKVARMYALPRRFYDEGVARYGFHGLSCEFIMQQLRDLDGGFARGRVVIAHLGNGASITAVQQGKSIDTSMGFTPAAGLVMGTRSGDVDPGLLIYLMEERKMSATEVNRLINKESGLLGVSGISEDMRDLLGKQSTDARATEAIDLFCYRARKYLGAYIAVLGGVDVLVFTAGIGQYAAAVRERICSGLEFLGIEIDSERNQANAPVISSKASRVKVRVIQTDEDLIVARHTVRLLGKGNGQDV